MCGKTTAEREKKSNQNHRRATTEGRDVRDEQHLNVNCQQLPSFCFSGCFGKAQYIVLNLCWTALKDPRRPASYHYKRRLICLQERDRSVYEAPENAVARSTRRA